MTRFDVIDTIQRLRAQGRPFCVATVVRTADLTSAKAGAKAVVTADGEILGHLGGGCVQRAVRTAAHQVLDAGAARMISVRPADAARASGPEIDVHASGCPSGGTVDLFIEPYRLPPRLRIIGQTPIARAVAAHAELMGFRIATGGPDDAADPAEPSDFVVIASQGAGDLAALRAAVTSPAAHVAMIASRRKAEHLKAKLAAEGVDAARLDAVESPAGLDLGAIDPHEIAISILARIVEHRRRPDPGDRRAP